MSEHGHPPPPGTSPPPPSGQPPPPGQPYLPPPGTSPPPPSGQPPPPGAWPGGPPGFPPAPPGYMPPPKKRSAWPWVLGVVGVIIVLMIVAAAVIVGVGAGSETPERAAGAESGQANPDGDAATGADDEVDDVGPCQWVDSENIVLDVTNDSSKQSSYIIDVNFLDADGARVGDEPFFVNYVRPGERTIETAYVFDSAGGVACEIAEVQRFESQSADDLAEVTCEPNGVDFADDIATVFEATNGSSETSDYFATAALMRDGIRIGTTFVSIANVRPGESAPGDGFSVVDGPDTGIECEVVDVSRASSE